MKKLIFRLTLPLTLISFGIITKWSYGIVIDGTDEFLYGFPLIYKCNGFHTSMSTQYFLIEMGINLLTYFIFWIIITLILNRIWKINIPKRITKIFWIGFGILFLGFAYLSNELDDQYLIKRDFDIKIFNSGFTIFGIHSTDREKYQTELKNWKEKQKRHHNNIYNLLLVLAYLRKSSRIFLVRFLFTKFSALKTQQIIYKSVVKHLKKPFR